MTLRTNKTTRFTCAMFVAIALSGCDSTPSMPDLSQVNIFNQTIEVSKPWQNEPLVKGNECNTFSYDNIASFINTYYISSANNTSTDDASMKTLENYLLSAVLVNRANLCLAEALELKELISDLEEEREILIGGTSISSSEMEKHREYSTEASAAIKETVEGIDALTPQQRENLTIGISTYIGGSYTFAQTYEHALKIVEEVKENSSNSAMDWLNKIPELASKGSTLAFVYDGMYSVGESWMDTTTSLYEFSKTNDVDLPDDATSMYRDMLSTQEEIEE
ncbi:hypothetical protein ACOI22_08755 [Glaciecola sp. 2405UD65-10]|uniref:hypothetical protein n=1 Tax=Glaciecola sp. 2405UD65-10 TaxID=3397244 RepID=UPI003B5AB358